MSTDIVIVAAARTAVGKFGGTLASTPAPELGAAVINELLKRAKLEGGQVGEVILGQVLQAGAGQNAARQAVVKAGLPHADHDEEREGGERRHDGGRLRVGDGVPGEPPQHDEEAPGGEHRVDGRGQPARRGAQGCDCADGVTLCHG